MTAMDSFLQEHQSLRHWTFILCGIFLYAIALNMFLAGNNIAAGGLAGIATVLNYLIPLKISVLIFLMNVPLLVVSLFVKGWKFTQHTIVSTVIYSVLVEVTSHVPTITNDPLVATVFGGAMYGLGMTLMVLGNGSTGGTDLINRILISYFPSISVGKMSMIIDGSVVVFAMAVFGNVEVGLYAILTIYVCSVVADKALMGFEKGNLCLIITSKPAQQVAEPIMKNLRRAVTQIDGMGMYAKVGRSVLLAAIKPAETPKVKKMLSQVDPDAFVVVIPASEVLGGTFKTLGIASKRP